jgi:hypothetical protein
VGRPVLVGGRSQRLMVGGRLSFYSAMSLSTLSRWVERRWVELTEQRRVGQIQTDGRRTRAHARLLRVERWPSRWTQKETFGMMPSLSMVEGTGRSCRAATRVSFPLAAETPFRLFTDRGDRHRSQTSSHCPSATTSNKPTPSSNDHPRNK